MPTPQGKIKENIRGIKCEKAFANLRGIYCKTTRTFEFICFNRTMRLLACLGLLFGVVLMTVGVWNLMEFAFMSKSFSVLHFFILLIGFLITLLSFFQLYSTFKTDALYQSIAYCGVIYSGVLSIFSFGIAVSLHYQGVGKLYSLLFCCLALIACIEVYFFLRHVNYSASIKNSADVSNA
ncbi:hypothetical protein TNIN_451761 [Trichonephila inaurata madagascariensis]|uniref:Uncharacterized protein n=1 Tax=Trichonephila inaurata madagascariensis TaxID=2747483 RepID=A0A8X7BN14_9ARAC|nr:hypothetical protein TNIN_451761 [Trichonephila inaurata madagascariensis]